MSLEQITLHKSLGVAVQDGAAAAVTADFGKIGSSLRRPTRRSLASSLRSTTLPCAGYWAGDVDRPRGPQVALEASRLEADA